MADDTTNGLSHIKRTAEERKFLAETSIAYNLQHHPDKWVKFERFIMPNGMPRSK